MRRGRLVERGDRRLPRPEPHAVALGIAERLEALRAPEALRRQAPLAQPRGRRSGGGREDGRQGDASKRRERCWALPRNRRRLQQRRRPRNRPAVPGIVSAMPLREPLPQLSDATFITDGGMETTLIFHEGLELPNFASFVLLDDEEGVRALREYFRPYVEIAYDAGVGIALDTPTWRANPDWGERLGYSPDALADVNPARRPAPRGAARGGRRAAADPHLGLHRSARRRLPGRRDDDGRGGRALLAAGRGVRRDGGRPRERADDDLRRGGDRCGRRSSRSTPRRTALPRTS